MIRLDSDERRKAIVAAAVPLFARKGFAGTTTKELAEAAGISEALLFRHFPSKKHLYGEILRLGLRRGSGARAARRTRAVDGHPRPYDHVHGALFSARRRRPGRARHAPASRAAQLSRGRGVCPGAVRHDLRAGPPALCRFRSRQRRLPATSGLNRSPRLTASGSAIMLPRWWPLSSLPGRASVPYQGSVSDLVDEASWFILRGIGVRDAAIASAWLAAARSPRSNSHPPLRWSTPMDGEQMVPAEGLLRDRARYRTRHRHAGRGQSSGW